MENEDDVEKQYTDHILSFRNRVLARRMEDEEVILAPDTKILRNVMSFYLQFYLPFLHKGREFDKNELYKEISLLEAEVLEDGFSSLIVIKYLLIKDIESRIVFKGESQDDEKIRIDAMDRTRVWLTSLINQGVREKGIHVQDEKIIFRTGAFPEVRKDLAIMIMEAYKLMLSNYADFLRGRRRFVKSPDHELLIAKGLDSTGFISSRDVYRLFQSRLKANIRGRDPIDFALEPIRKVIFRFDLPFAIRNIPILMFIRQQEYIHKLKLSEDQAEFHALAWLGLRLYKSQSFNHRLDLRFLGERWKNRRLGWMLFDSPSNVILHQMEQFLLGYSFVRSLQVQSIESA